MNGWELVLLVFGIIGVLFISIKYVLPKLLKFVTLDGLQEILTDAKEIAVLLANDKTDDVIDKVYDSLIELIQVVQSVQEDKVIDTDDIDELAFFAIQELEDYGIKMDENKKEFVIKLIDKIVKYYNK